MVNLYKYFELWNNIDEATSTKTLLFVVLVLISASAGIYFLGKSLKNVTDDKSYILGILCVVILGFSVFSVINTRPKYEKPIILNAQTEIKKELNVDLTEKQVRKILNNQPAWANQLTKEDIKKHLD